MKKMTVYAVLAAAFVAVGMTGCGKKKTPETEVIETEAPETEKPQRATELVSETVAQIDIEQTAEKTYKQKMANNFRHLNADAFKNMMDTLDEMVIVDLRSEEEYKAGHIPGAVNVPLDTLNDDTLGSFDKSIAVFVYADTSANSRKGASIFCGAEFQGVMEVGAFSDWSFETEQ